MPYLHRLYIEDLDGLDKIVSRHLDGFTILKGVGYFRGIRENAAIVEVIYPYPLNLSALVDDIKRGLDQQAVLVTISAVEQVDTSGENRLP
jgi:hypothetical protein